MKASALFLALVALSAPGFAQKAPQAPPLVHQINNGNWLSQKEAESLRDELLYQRAVHAYMTILPALCPDAARARRKLEPR